jgi:hypothetical protein
MMAPLAAMDRRAGGLICGFQEILNPIMSDGWSHLPEVRQ